MSEIFKVSWQDVKSAIVSALLTALAAIGAYIYALGSIWKIDWHMLIDVGVLGAIPGMISILKSWLTTSNGKFVGLIKIK